MDACIQETERTDDLNMTSLRVTQTHHKTQQDTCRRATVSRTCRHQKKKKRRGIVIQVTNTHTESAQRRKTQRTTSRGFHTSTKASEMHKHALEARAKGEEETHSFNLAHIHQLR